MSDLITTLSAVREAAGLAGDVGDFLEQIFARVEKVRARKLSAQNYLRAYYFEVIANLELFDVLDLGSFARAEVNSDALRFILTQLRTDLGSTILFAEDLGSGTELYRLLQDKGRIANPRKLMVRMDHGREEPVKSRSFYENILQAVSFTVVKTEVLRRLSTWNNDQTALLRNLRLEPRLLNIEARYRMIKEAMDRLPGIRDLAR